MAKNPFPKTCEDCREQFKKRKCSRCKKPKFLRDESLDPEVNYFLRVWNLHRVTKALPFAGGYMDQPNKMLHAFEIIGGEMSILEADEMKQKQVEANLPKPKTGRRHVSRPRRR